ncbi:RNase A-like domain-containing protein [Paenibacillus sp. FSL W8-0186]|uniref:RNase A-like domain-containing protein n=1 Tax=Paenibacillus sp. FSL W8-0186 TaxID=2921709 RepID=UPI0030D013AE
MDPGRVGGLARDLERLERTMENGITGMSRELNRLISDVEAAYSDPSEHYVRSAAREASGLLREIGKLAERIDEQMRKKVQALRYAENEYIKVEKNSTKATSVKKSATFTLKGTIQSWFQRFLEKGRQNVADPGEASSAESRPSLLQWIKGSLLELQDASLVQRLDPVKEDERIASLLQILDTGTAKEQAWAREELEAIASSFKEIARNQAAYKIYAIYDNELYMGYAHRSAQQQREQLAKLGVAEEWYKSGVSLAVFYKGSPLDACEYNPLKQDLSAMPKESELRLMIAAGMINPLYREWARLHYDAIAAAVRQAAERRREMQALFDEYNQAVPAEDIRNMQQYLKDMNIYQGEVTGEYNQEFLIAVAGYQHIANTVSTMAAVRREWFGWELFEVDGKITKELLDLAWAESSSGMRNNPNLNTGGLTAAVTIVGVGDGIVSQLFEDVKDLAEFAVNSNPATLGFWTDTVPGYYAIGEAIATGELTIHDMRKLLGDAAAEEFVVPFQDIIELQPKVLSGKATYEESVKYGRAVTKAFFALTVVEGAARAGAKFSGKTVKELVKTVKEAAQTRPQTSLTTPDGFTIPVRDMDMPKTEPQFSKSKPDSGSGGGKMDSVEGAGKSSASTIRNSVSNDLLDDMESKGGHLLDKHVSKTNEDLLKRAAQEGVPSTTFYNKSTALKATQENIRKNAEQISNWLNNPNSRGYLITKVKHEYSVGRGVDVKNGGNSASKQVTDNLTTSQLYLVKDPSMPAGYRIITGYPVFE